MPPYVTVGEGGPASPDESRPLHRFPDTIGGLYDLGMRHHQRVAVLLRPAGTGFEELPDWRLDRLVIRLALYAQERLGLENGDRVAIVGRLDWLWPAAEFAALGAGAVPVGLEHDLSDAGLAGALGDAAPRLSIATDPVSAERLLQARAAGVATGALLLPAAAGAPDVHPLAAVLELGATLDTAERAGAFRECARSLSPDAACCWHYAGDGRFFRLTHRDALVRVADQISTRPALRGDVAYVEAPRVGLATRLALYAFVGDGHTASALGREGRLAEDVAALRPHRLLVPGDWVAEAWRGALADSDGWLRRLAQALPLRWLRERERRGKRLRRALAARFGDRARWIEASGTLETAVVEGLMEAGIGTIRISSAGLSGEVAALSFAHGADAVAARGGNARDAEGSSSG